MPLKTDLVFYTHVVDSLNFEKNPLILFAELPLPDTVEGVYGHRDGVSVQIVGDGRGTDGGIVCL